jgi:hypothetical protein
MTSAEDIMAGFGQAAANTRCPFSDNGYLKNRPCAGTP